MSSAGFGARLRAAMDARGPLCVGIDPHPWLLQAWGFDDDAQGLRRFALGVVEALGAHAAAMKPQSAFFERQGPAGVGALQECVRAVRAAGALAVLDVKRGDIGSTMSGYAQAYLGTRAPLACDALTLSPYLGFGSLAPALDAAERAHAGAFVLALTSNPEGRALQGARLADGRSVARAIVEDVARHNGANRDLHHLGDVGVVVGATVGAEARREGIDFARFNGPILAPGIGAQGATSAQLRALFGHPAPQVLASASRSILRAGPRPGALRAAFARARDAAAASLLDSPQWM